MQYVLIIEQAEGEDRFDDAFNAVEVFEGTLDEAKQRAEELANETYKIFLEDTGLSEKLQPVKMEGWEPGQNLRKPMNRICAASTCGLLEDEEIGQYAIFFIFIIGPQE